MARTTSARRLAQAAFEVAAARGELEAWETDFVAVLSVLANADVIGFMESPQVPISEKYAGVNKLLGGASQRVRNFVCVLVSRRQVRKFSSIDREFQRLADQRRGLVRATVTSAVPLDEQRRRRVAVALGELVGSKVMMTEKVDPSVLGGIVARVGDRLVDGSTRTRLHNLRSALAERPV